MSKRGMRENGTIGAILINMVIAAASLFVNGFGVFLTIRAGIGAGPWDVFNLGLSKTFGILYGTASISVSAAVLLIDIALREPIGIAMIIDAITVGKSVDLFNALGVIPAPHNLADSVLMMLLGLTIMGYTQYFYMMASLGCGPRDTLLVGLKKRSGKIPIGAVSVAMLALVTLVGYLLGGPVGLGTLLCAFATGPIMQAAFATVRFDAARVKHQSIVQSVKVFAEGLRW